MEGHEPPLPKERRRASIPCLPVDAKRSRHAPAPTTTRSRSGSSRAPRRLDARRRRSLSEFGLKYDDIRIESDADYAKALDRLQQRVQIKFHAPSAPLVERISTSRNRPHQQHDRIAAVVIYTALTGLHAGLPHAELQLRARRMKRAFDVSFKRKALPPDLRALQKPLEGYAGPLIEEAKARRVERELLNTF